MLSEEEIKVSDMIAHKIVDDCLLYGSEKAPTCIRERVSGLTYTLEIGKSLPQGHPVRECSLKISDIIDGIKAETYAAMIPNR